MVGSFLLLAVPGLFAWGFDGFVAGRIAGVLLMLAVRRHFVRTCSREWGWAGLPCAPSRLW